MTNDANDTLAVEQRHKWAAVNYLEHFGLNGLNRDHLALAFARFERDHMPVANSTGLHDLIGEVYERGYTDALEDADVPADFYSDEMSQGCAQVQADFLPKFANQSDSTGDTPTDGVREAWNGPENAPQVKVGASDNFIVAVRRAHSGRAYTFPAQYLNAMLLLFDHDDEENERACTGWYQAEADDDDGTKYRELLSPGDALLGWQKIQQWSDAALSPVCGDGG